MDVALAIALRDGKVLVARRLRGHLAGSWEFPGGRLNSGETPAEAARRELLEETGVEAGALEPLVMLVHDYADRPLRLHCYLATDLAGEVRMDEARPWAWKTPRELDALEMPAANRGILKALRWRLPG